MKNALLIGVFMFLFIPMPYANGSSCPYASGTVAFEGYDTVPQPICLNGCSFILVSPGGGCAPDLQYCWASVEAEQKSCEGTTAGSTPDFDTDWSNSGGGNPTDNIEINLPAPVYVSCPPGTPNSECFQNDRMTDVANLASNLADVAKALSLRGMPASQLANQIKQLRAFNQSDNGQMIDKLNSYINASNNMVIDETERKNLLIEQRLNKKIAASKTELKEDIAAVEGVDEETKKKIEDMSMRITGLTPIMMSAASRNDINGVLTHLFSMMDTQAEIKGEATAAKKSANNAKNSANKARTAVEQLSTNFDAKMTSLNGDISALNTSLEGLQTSIDGLGDGNSDIDMSGVEGGLSEIKGAIGETNGLLRGDGLTAKGGGEGILDLKKGMFFSEADKKLVEDETTALLSQIPEEIQKFKSLFNLGTDGFQNGRYQDHFFEFSVPNQGKFSVKSGVFPALLENSGLIQTIIIFLATLAGIRMLARD